MIKKHPTNLKKGKIIFFLEIKYKIYLTLKMYWKTALYLLTQTD